MTFSAKPWADRLDLMGDMTASTEGARMNASGMRQAQELFDGFLRDLDRLSSTLEKLRWCKTDDRQGLVFKSLLELDHLGAKFRNSSVSWLNQARDNEERSRQYDRWSALFVAEGEKLFEAAEACRPAGYFVYFLCRDHEDRPVYIGQSQNWASRIATHFKDTDKEWDYYKLIECKTHSAMVELEAQLINKYRPEYNKHIPATPGVAARHGGWYTNLRDRGWGVSA
ncbi:hypothetical protein EBQ81_04850 [bacterium]|nr:hypothetical protein [bacterium]